MNATSVEELRNRMVAILTTLADTPPGSGIEEVTSVDGSIIIDNTDPSAPNLSLPSGAWNPTPTNVIGSPTVSVISGNYSRVGTVVTCSLFLDVTMGVAENVCEFRLDLPIASNFAQEKNAFGIISSNGGGSTELVNWNIKANTSTDDINIELESVTDEFNFTYIYAILQYVII